ncbi:MAG: Na+/H+ antiporter, partial [Chitinophagaceae bacterium]
SIVFVMNGLIFMLIGLQLPIITQQLGDIGLTTAIKYGLLISLALIVTRLLCAFGAALFTRIASRFITVADPNPGWKSPLIAGWAGMRGVVSLAAALSIPVVIQGDQPFPYRNLILFMTFIVILVTLVFQGLTLPWLIRRVNPTDRFNSIPEQQQEIIIQKKIAQYSLQFLEEKYDGKVFSNEHVNNLYARLKLDLDFFNQEMEEITNVEESTLMDYQRMYLDLLDRQRKLLHEMNGRMEFEEELIRKYLSLIDFEEYKVREKMFLEESPV